jgi:hypothetical protein
MYRHHVRTAVRPDQLGLGWSTDLSAPLDSPDLAGAKGHGQPKVVTGRFELRDGKLYLTQPGGQTEDVYVRDDFE